MQAYGQVNSLVCLFASISIQNIQKKSEKGLPMFLEPGFASQ
jgi:hypothetical protein